MPAHAYNKLKSKKIGPLEVLERINDNAYRLKLPADMNTSDVFNVKYLSRFFSDFFPSDAHDSGSNPSQQGRPDAASDTPLAPTS
ncbi:hypothetical protein Bca101_029397 [Brassica carinata]